MESGAPTPILPPEPEAALTPTEPALVAPPFDLPSARQLVGRGFELTLAAGAQIRRASLYIGLLIIAFVAPAVVVGALAAGVAPADLQQLLRDASSGSEAAPGTPAAQWAVVVTIETMLVLIAFVGALAVAIEAQMIAVAILGGQHVGRPLGLRGALVRSRQTFWRMVMAWLLVSLPLLLVQSAIVEALDAVGLSSAGLSQEGATALAALIAGLLGSPFGYVLAGIVIGDVGPGQAIARSVRLARTRWRLAVVIALFATVFSWIEVFALGAGGDILVRVGEAVHLGFDTDVVHSALTLVVVLAAAAAAASLIFTAGAVTAAPQVVAFVGLTHFHEGLDRAREQPSPALAPGAASTLGPAPQSSAWAAGQESRPSFRWVTRPMLAAIALAIALAAVGITDLVSQLY